jgi:hypothetical protein
VSDNILSTAGSANTGGGGGGGAQQHAPPADNTGVNGTPGSAGGSGVVMVTQVNRVIASGVFSMDEVYSEVKAGNWSNSF